MLSSRMTTSPTHDTIERFWRDWLATLAADSRYRALPRPPANAFGDSPALADELLAVILNGRKTATCASLWECEFDGDPIPEVGNLEIVLDGAGRPRCIIEITEVTIRAFDEVDPVFAAEEGEGDRTLESWRKGHWAFFERIFVRIGRTPDPAMPLVCQRFRVLHRAPEVL